VLAADPEPVAQVLSLSGPAMLDSGRTGSTGSEAHAEAVLRRAMSAPDRFAYAGIREVDSFDAGAPTILRLAVHHAPRQGTSFEVVDRPPGATATFVAQSEAAASGGLAGAPLQQLANAYDLSVGPSASVLDRPATVVQASRSGAVEARFWVDDRTGLLLRREIYAAGRVVRSSAFTRLHVSRSGFLPHLPPELEAPSATKLAKTSAPLLGDDGWTCPPRLSGHFSLTRLDRLETDANVMRASYSDGLSTVSVFEQRGSLGAVAMPGLSRQTMRGTTVLMRFGLPTVAVWSSGGTVYTVVTDAPDDTATAVVASLPHSRRAPVGMGKRLATGLQRLAGRLDPDL
jgi:negative regulator of sigma E activity